ncbi:hypothetical protein P9112_000177 [Eukaryota sp. TZLM1-RC]
MDNLINIDGSTTLGYRYKMPPIESKVEGRGNGIKTVIPNIDVVAKSLKVDPAFCVRWLGMELGAQSTWNEVTRHAVVNGAHDASMLQSTLQGFINRFVLCPRCRLPELNMGVQKKDIMFDCRACGVNTKCSTKHKIVSFIKKVLTSTRKDTEEGPVLDAELEARLDRAEAAVPSSHVKTEEEFLEENIEKVRNFINDGHTADEVLEHIRLICVAAEYDDSQRYLLIFFTVLTMEKDDPLASAQKHLPILAGAFHELKGQVLFLKLLGKFFTVFSTLRDQYFLHLLGYLYNEDFLEEDVILAWYDQNPGRPLRAASKPFIDWLRSAETESEDSSEEESD